VSVETRRDTVRALREALDFVRSVQTDDEKAVRRFAVAQALEINGADRQRRRRTEELWQHLNLRGAALMERRGVFPQRGSRSGWGVAAGS
jgi:hypothetical protein